MKGMPSENTLIENEVDSFSQPLEMILVEMKS
jgi:hypothetical protein